MLSTAVFLFLLKEYSCFLVFPPVAGSNESLFLPTLNGSFKEEPQFLRNGVNSGLHRPVYFDWRLENKVSPVKDQGGCAACWAFTTVANIESHLAITYEVQEILSEQFLIDCDEAKKGCNDASILETFGHIVSKLGGVLRDRDYFPYSEHPEECRWKPSEPDYLDNYPKPVPMIGFQRVKPNDEEAMANAVFAHGPLSAAINSASMARYIDGIDGPSEEDCNPNELNHAVLIVGYNVHFTTTGEEIPYWIIKNSWGTNWGYNGFYYLVRGRNACGIAKDVSFAYV